MEAFRSLLVARTGYPRYGAIAQASRESGVAQSLLSQYVSGALKPEPDTLAKLAEYLDRPYDELLLMVWGKGSVKPTRRAPLTPHDQALRAADVIAAAMAELRASLVAMGSASQPSNDSRKKRSSTNSSSDYSYQTPVQIGRVKRPYSGDPKRAVAAA